MKNIILAIIFLVFISGCTSNSTNQNPSFMIEADDFGFYKDGQNVESIELSKNSPTQITFKVKNENVYFGGIDFRGCGQQTQTAHEGENTTITITANENCEIISYWPSSGEIKSHLQIIVK